MPKPKIDTAPLDPLIIEEIKKREKEKRKKEEHPQIPLDIPEYDPEEEKRWREEEEKRKKEKPGNVEKIDLA